MNAKGYGIHSDGYGITPSHALKIIKNQRWKRKITGISPENPRRTAA